MNGWYDIIEAEETSIMNNLIYYFSGTGNSLHVARKLAEKLENCRIEPITAYMNLEKVEIESCDTLGFVFPIYGSDLPWVVKDFVERMQLENEPYIYGVGTCNERGGRAMETFSGIMTLNGFKVSYIKKIDMPGNCHESNEDENRERLSLEQFFVDHIAENIRNRMKSTIMDKKGEDNNSRFAREVNRKMSSYMNIHVEKDLCIGCGICEQVCSMNNITIKDNVAVHGEDCLNCMACFHYCPVNAVRLAFERGQYHHPEITPQDLAEQKKRK